MTKSDYVGPAPDGKVIYVIVGEREKFDKIDRPVTDHSQLERGQKVLSKTIGDQLAVEGLVIFQHWLDTPEVVPANA